MREERIRDLCEIFREPKRISFMETCPTCEGSGTIFNGRKCKDCGGRGKLRKPKED